VLCDDEFNLRGLESDRLSIGHRSLCECQWMSDERTSTIHHLTTDVSVLVCQFRSLTRHETASEVDRSEERNLQRTLRHD
jgi:hypothetical protein